MRWWKAFWAFAGPLVSLIGLAILLMPKVTIDTGVNLDASQPLSTQFLVTNRGRVPVFKLAFSCGFVGKFSADHFVAKGEDLSPVAELSPGKAVSKACAFASRNIATSGLRVVATYSWPIVGLRSSEFSDFVIKQGAAGYVLVPTSLP